MTAAHADCALCEARLAHTDPAPKALVRVAADYGDDS